MFLNKDVDLICYVHVRLDRSCTARQVSQHNQLQQIETVYSKDFFVTTYRENEPQKPRQPKTKLQVTNNVLALKTIRLDFDLYHEPNTCTDLVMANAFLQDRVKS